MSKRYAEAIFSLARERDIQAVIDRDLKTIADILRKDKRLQLFLSYPEISTDRKNRLAGEVFAKLVSKPALNFLQLLIKKRRINLFGQICEEYGKLEQQAKGVLAVEVRTAIELDSAERIKLEDSLKGMLTRNIEVHPKVDPEVVGGVIVRAGDTVIDGSVRRRLERLRERVRGLK